MLQAAFVDLLSIFVLPVRLVRNHFPNMQYAMLVYHNEPEFLALTTEEQDRLRNDCADWYERLLKEGRAVGASRLEPIATATTLREPNGRLVITDGPFAETKEILAGFVMLECQNLDEAIALVRTFPYLRAQVSLELRPVMQNGVRRSDAP